MSIELVGRDEELLSVGRFLGAIPRGARAMVIEGEAGAGKTSVWRAALDRAREDGAVVLSARPAQAETSFAHAALGDLIRAQHETMARLPSPQRRALETALLLADHDGETPDQQVIALAALGVLRALAERAPMVVAIDDVQWLDAPSAAVLRFAARRLGDDRVGLLLAQRTAGGEPAPLELERALAPDRLTRVGLSPLSLGAVQHLLQLQLAYVPSRPVLHRLHELSGGNPFFALELARALRAGTLRLEPGERLPVTLDALVGARMSTLSAGALHALAVAASMAQPTAELVVRVSGLDGDVLAEAERAQIVELRDGKVQFTHPLLASAAYALVDAAARRELHAGAAASVVDPEERARHLALAATGPDEAVARALEDAAMRAEARGAPTSAAELYKRAARLTPSDHGRDVCLRTMNAAFCVFQTGDSRRAREMLEGVVGRLQPGSDRARALIRLALVRGYDDDLRAAEALLREALHEAEGDEELVAAAHNNLCSILFRLRERLDEAVEHGRAASAAALDAGLLGIAAEALGGRVLAEAALGRESAAETLQSALALQPGLEHARALAQPLFQVACAWLWWDELERARDAFEWLRQRAVEMGDEGSLPYVLVLAAQVECVRGDVAAAARHADEGYALTQQTGQATLGAYLLALRALADAIAGDAQKARQRAERALTVADRTSGRPAEHFATAALGLLELSLGRPAETNRVLAPLVEFLRREKIVEPGTARVVADHVEGLIAVGELGAADELLDWYEGNARRLQRRSAIAASARCRGLLAAAKGDPVGALVELERALEISDGVPIPLERGRTQLAFGAAHRRAKHKRAARETLESARETFERMGAHAWAERAREELARVGGRAPSLGALTPTEQRVAELVAEGLQSKQVAAALFVSQKTVEGHLTHIYSKLGVRSRTELARRLGEGGRVSETSERPRQDSNLRSAD
jgi:DNA-binding CsgD family transcriptional regulator